MVLAYVLHVMQKMIKLAGQTSRAGGHIYLFIPFTPTTPGIAAGLSEFCSGRWLRYLSLLAVLVAYLNLFHNSFQDDIHDSC